MIFINKNESFPITVSLLDEELAGYVSGKEVLYDIRTIDGNLVSPPISGSLYESTVASGIYVAEITIPVSGSYICYATCSGFLASTEEIVVMNENPVEISKYNLPYNISVIDVPRLTVSGDITASQNSRKVPYGKTDYVITLIKQDEALDWSNPVSSGISYAHYMSFDSELPYMMGGEY